MIDQIRRGYIETSTDLLRYPRESIVKICEKSNGHISPAHMQNLFALKIWLIRQKSKNVTCDITDFTEEMLDKIVMELAIAEMNVGGRGVKLNDDEQEGQDLRNSSVRRNAIQPEKFHGQNKKFATWRCQVEAYMGSHNLEYILRHSDKLYGFVASESSRDYVDTHEPSDERKAKASYKQGNNFVFQQLKSLTAGGAAYQLIRDIEDSCDGRKAWLTLCRFYESAGVTSGLKMEAHNVIMNLIYKGETRHDNYTSYVARHISAAATLKRLNEPVADLFHKEQFIKNIQCKKLVVQVEFAHSHAATWTFDELQRYFSSMVAVKNRQADQDGNRSANFTASNKGGARKGKKLRQARKVQSQPKFKSNYSTKGTGKKDVVIVPPDIWKTMSEGVRNEIIAKNQAARKARAAHSSSNDSSDKDSESVNTYSATTTVERTAKLVGSKLAKRTSKEIRTSAATRRDGEPKQDEGDKLSNQKKEKSKTSHTASFNKETPKKTLNAGTLFGRDGLDRRAMVVSSWSRTGGAQPPVRNLPAAFARLGKTRKSQESGHCIVDSGADTVCVGDGFKIMARSGRIVTLKGFDDGKDLRKEVEVVCAATAWDDNDGTTFILVFNEALDLGRDQRTSLLCPNQMRFAGHQVDDIPRFLTKGRSIHGILTCDNMHLPFDMQGHTSYLATRTPSADELNSCEHVVLTSDAPWDPDEDDWAELENKYTQKQRNAANNKPTGYTVRNVATVAPFTGELRSVNPAFTGRRQLDIPMHDIRRRFGNVPQEVVEATLLNTTQLAERCGEMPLHRRYKTKFAQLRYRRLKSTLYSDTFSSNVKSVNGYTKTQGFVNGESLFIFHFPMTSESYAHYGLICYIHEVGIPAKIHTDNAKVEVLGHWKKTTRDYHIKVSVTEPYSAWQNRCEREFGKVRTSTRTLLETFNVPDRLWPYAQAHAVEVHNHTARKVLEWKTPYEVETGDTPDCSHLLYFDFYQPVWYWDDPSAKFPVTKRKIGRWLGVARNVGQALCFYILNENANVIARSTVKALDDNELLRHSRAITEFDSEVRGILGENEVEQITSETERAEIAKSFATVSTDDCSVSRNRHVTYDMYTEDDTEIETGLTVDDYIDESTETPNTEKASSGEHDILGTSVLLSRDGEMQRAEVKRKKRDRDGQVLTDDTGEEQYIVEFPDGTQMVHQYSALVDAIFIQIDETGDEWYTFKSIIAHERRARGGRGKTRGWFLQVEWLNGEVTWEPLTALKDSTPYEVAAYAQENDLLNEPAFAHWAKHVLKKRDRYVRIARKRKLNNRYKYGIEVPRDVAHAIELDRKNGNTLWQDAIAKEMGSLGDHSVFKLLARGEPPPEDHQFIPMWIIFDVKMNLTRKARLVAGGHVTKTPAWDCYCSVASRQSVRLAFLAAAINGNDLVMIDVGNAFVNALCKEKVYARAGPEFGDDEGRLVIIVKALYGLRSSGSAWHSHFSDTLRSLCFTPSRADMDMWMRCQTKPDGSKYYEYLVVYVDDVLIISHDPHSIVKAIENRPYELKGGTAPESYLGANIGKYTIVKGIETWYMSSSQYLDRAISVVEAKLGKLLPGSKIKTPLPTDYHPELDTSPYLEEDDANYYLSLIGILQWLCELGRVDICFAVGLMSRFNALPRQNHMDTVLRVFAYLKQHKNSKLVFDYRQKDIPEEMFQQYDWTEMYPDAQEEIPEGMPEPLGQSVRISVFADAAHADDLVTRRSTTGIIVFINGTPIRWYSKRQNTVEGSTYGSEFIALRIASEMIIALRHDLRMLGFPLNGPADLFCDNQSVVINSSIPSSVLKKKHNSISYHKVRECIASGTLRVGKEPTETNLADILTKPLAGPRFKELIKHILW